MSAENEMMDEDALSELQEVSVERKLHVLESNALFEEMRWLRAENKALHAELKAQAIKPECNGTLVHSEFAICPAHD